MAFVLFSEESSVNILGMARFKMLQLSFQTAHDLLRINVSSSSVYIYIYNYIYILFAGLVDKYSSNMTADKHLIAMHIHTTSTKHCL